MKINVIIVTEVPQFVNPQLQSGIRNKEEAAAWAEKNGFSTVYLLAKRERIYADRLTVRVDAQAKQIERKSRKLLRLTERGCLTIEDALLILLTAIILFLVGNLLGWPW